MFPQFQLLYASIAFAVLWTAGMYWWNSPMDAAGAVILMVAGALAGVLWYYGMRLWLRWSGRANG